MGPSEGDGEINLHSNLEQLPKEAGIEREMKFCGG